MVDYTYITFQSKIVFPSTLPDSTKFIHQIRIICIKISGLVLLGHTFSASSWSLIANLAIWVQSDVVVVVVQLAL